MKPVFKACTSNHTVESEQELAWVVPYLCSGSSFDIDDNILQEGMIAVNYQSQVKSYHHQHKISSCACD